MYNNIGSKIKGLAARVFAVEAIIAVITGFAILISSDFEGALWAILTIIFGPIVAWISSWILYAFGEMVENIALLREGLVPNATVPKSSDITMSGNFEPTCDFCGKNNVILKTYKSKSTVGMDEAEFRLCEKCAKDNNLI